MKYTFNIWSHHGAMNSLPVFTAFQKGAQRQGWKISYNEDRGGIDVIWSVLWNGRMYRNKKIWETAKKNNQPIIVLEVGALHRNKTWKMGVGGINNDAYFGERNNNRERADRLGLELKPWKTNKKGSILVAGQHNNSGQWDNQSAQEQWTMDCLHTIRKHTKKTIVLRQHPRCSIRYSNLPTNTVLQIPKKIPGSYDDYDFNISKAYAVVNWSSNPGIIAAINGVPVFTGPSSLASDIGNSDLNDINNPATPDRRQWLNDLAYTEWTTEEISTGWPISRLTSYINNVNIKV
jgi:hypothetical protein